MKEIDEIKMLLSEIKDQATAGVEKIQENITNNGNLYCVKLQLENNIKEFKDFLYHEFSF